MKRLWNNVSLCAALWIGTGRFAVAETMPDAISTGDAAFAIPLQVDADPQIMEVRLYVSADGGKSWRVESRRRPPVTGFEFRAPTDGEYWFHVRTVDAAGGETPDGPILPEMRVVVDSKPPQAELTAVLNTSGDIVADWRVADAKLNAQSLKWSYRAISGGPWLPLESVRSKQNDGDTQAAGRIEFVRPTGADKIELRLEIADAAGNVASRSAELALSGPLPASPIGTPAESNSPRASGTTPIESEVPVAARPATTPPMPVRDPFRPLPVNSLSFELEYEVDQFPASEIGKVEIWGTRDNGRSWIRVGIDDDRRSPCAVTVDREGLYGFSIVVDAAGVPSTTSPKPGDRPEIRVEVDLKNPQVRLTTAEPDPEGRPDSLKINWTATDAHLGPQAVSLAYSDSPNGPWLPLAVGVPNDGSRVCRFDSNCPENVYLRIEVRDEAGNLGAFSTTTPIPIEKRSLQIQFAGATREGDRAKAAKWFHVLR